MLTGRGRLLGDHRHRVHYSASVVKVMFMAAYLRQREVRDRRLRRSDRDLLGPMIKRSDNKSASAIYGMVGEKAIVDVARAADMRHFRTQATWGLSEITAGDQARFVGRLERYVPRRHERYALGLMARVIDKQRWGMPPAKPKGWKIHFKGGWSPGSGSGWRVNQVALLRRGEKRISIAVLTRDNPSFRHGKDSIRGVAQRLLRGVGR